MMEFLGEFEIHLTVQLGQSGPWQALNNWAISHGFKFLHIVLARGQSCSQPMLTQRCRGGLTEVLTRAGAVETELAQAGFSVNRIKIEAAPWNQDIPKGVLDLAQDERAGDRYFEHHLKLELPQHADRAVLTQIAQQHHAHLSRNTFQLRSDSLQERFMTQRCSGVGLHLAQEQLQQLIQAIAPCGYPILSVEAEYVVYDSNLELDAGWLESSCSIV